MTDVAQTIEQQRAAFALDEINAALEGPAASQSFRKEFRSYGSALPAMIHMNGLGQAAAFCCAKGGTYGKLYDILSRWMISEGQPLAGHKNLLNGITAPATCTTTAWRKPRLWPSWSGSRSSRSPSWSSRRPRLGRRRNECPSLSRARCRSRAAER